ncbi:MAG: winged helix-turn-helix domain-containing protein [Rhizobacter sp.]
MNQPLASPFAERPITFGPFTLLPASGVLLEGGRPVRLGGRAFGLLAGLLQRAGEVVSKAELIALVWPGDGAEETTLRVHIGALRKVLGDGQGGVRYIANVAGRGYAFVGTVDRAAESTMATAPPPAVPSAARARRPLPARLARLVGRDDVVASLVRHLPHKRLITLCGAGGMGKTTVALAAAEQLLASYPDGVHFVDLCTITEPALVPDAVAAAVDFAPPAADGPGALVAYLRHKRLLLVLDGCEHLLEAAASMVVTLLPAAPGVDVIATSREPLQCDGEWVQRLPPLACPPVDGAISAVDALRYPAVQLFVERAIASLDSFQLGDDDAPRVSELCASLDGMPFALELAAAQVDAFGIRGLLRLLDDRFRVLSNGMRHQLPRHRTLRALLDWSFDSLSPVEQRTLSRLAVFRGEFTVEWAAAVAGHDLATPFALVDAIGSLAAKSLLAVDTASDTVRYRLLDTTRVYAHEKLVQRGEDAEARRRHAEHWCTLFGEAARETVGPSRAAWVDTHGRALHDVRAALDWALAPGGDPRLAATLVMASHPLAHYVGVIDEWRRHMERCLQHAHVLDARTEQRLNCWRGALLGQTHGCPPALGEALARAEAIGEAATDPDLVVEGFKSRWLWAFSAADYRVARDAALGVHAAAAHDPFARIWAERAHAQASHFLGEDGPVHEVALRVLAEASPMEHRRQHLTIMVDRRVSVGSLHARALWLEGQADEAEEALRLPLACAELDLPHALCHALAFSAVPIALWRGELDVASARIDRLVEHAERHGLGYWASWGHHQRRVVAWRRGEAVDFPAWSARVAAQTDELSDMMATLASPLVTDRGVARVREGRVGWCAPEVLRVSAMQSLRRGANPAGVREAVGEALALAERRGMLAWELRAATSLARLWSEAGEPDRGRDVLAAVCERFTEGFATADWRAARRLLATSDVKVTEP